MAAVAAAETPFVRLHAVGLQYGQFRPVLSDVNLELRRSEFALLTGARGAGKSSLLRLVATLQQPSRGEVAVGGARTDRLRGAALAFLRRSIGIVPQHPLLLADRTVLENVMLPALVSGLARAEAQSRAQTALARVKLACGEALPRQLSAGEQQLVCLARAIVNRPALLVVDEPTAHLDAESTQLVLQLLEQFAIGGVAVLMATHGNVQGIPARARRVILRDGRLHE
ncbi:MAG: ATP-binding cassette domain-containing protein [Burkholderiaceae bacterium]|nr:ATP-binding cassette domain-containing protein [Burkholderiaceae bacterium]